MLKHIKTTLFAAFLGATFLSTACSSRYILDVVDDGQGRASVIKTFDTKNYLLVKVEKEVFWDCTEADGKMKCTKSCDREDERGEKIMCPTVKTPGWQ